MGRDLIRLCNMQFYGRHGVNPEEQVLGQRFEVDVDLRVDTRPAALQDDLRLTINYAQVYKAVKQIVEEERFRFDRNARRSYRYAYRPSVCARECARVCTQTAAPMKGVLDYVAVDIERTQELWQSST